MTFSSIGDQARAYALQSASNRIKTTVATLSAEMASGEVSDVAGRFQGNTRMLSDVDARLAMLGQFQKNAAEAAIVTKGMTDVMVSMQDIGSDLSTVIISDGFSDSPSIADIRADQANEAFQTMVSRLNGTIGERFLFSGAQIDTEPLVPATQMLDDLTALTRNMTTASDVANAVSAWFDAPQGAGGFLDRSYRGSSGKALDVAIGPDQNVSVGTNASSPAIRDQLKAAAIAALASRPVLDGNPSQRNQLLAIGGRKLMQNADALIGEAGRVGLSQQIIDRTQQENASMLSTLGISRNTMRSADPYETAAALTQAQSQLETLYAVTARLSKLKLVDYLR